MISRQQNQMEDSTTHEMVKYTICSNDITLKDIASDILHLYLLVSSADNFCKKFGPRLGLKKCLA